MVGCAQLGLVGCAHLLATTFHRCPSAMQHCWRQHSSFNALAFLSRMSSERAKRQRSRKRQETLKEMKRQSRLIVVKEHAALPLLLLWRLLWRLFGYGENQCEADQ
jgi:hypothetical protein